MCLSAESSSCNWQSAANAEIQEFKNTTVQEYKIQEYKIQAQFEQTVCVCFSRVRLMHNWRFAVNAEIQEYKNTTAQEQTNTKQSANHSFQ